MKRQLIDNDLCLHEAKGYFRSFILKTYAMTQLHRECRILKRIVEM